MRPKNRLLIILFGIAVVLSACTGSRERTCYYFPSCDRSATRPTCDVLLSDEIHGSPIPPDILVGQVPYQVLVDSLGPIGFSDSLVFKSRDADAVWWFDATGCDDDGFCTGSQGLMALKGCTIIAWSTFGTVN